MAARALSTSRCLSAQSWGSEGNENALVEPCVSAVNDAMRPEWTDRGLAWIEAFDALPLIQIVYTMRELDLFSEQSLPRYLGMVITNKLAKVFAPPSPPPKQTRARPPRGSGQWLVR